MSNLKPVDHQLLLDKLVEIAADWGADKYLSDGDRTLESDMEQLILDTLEKQPTKSELKEYIYFLESKIRQRCLLFGCVYGIEHIDKIPSDRCIYCGYEASNNEDFYGDSLGSITKVIQDEINDILIKPNK